jgi:hypothetical protein
MPTGLTNVRLRGNSGHGLDIAGCPQMTDAVDKIGD